MPRARRAADDRWNEIRRQRRAAERAARAAGVPREGGPTSDEVYNARRRARRAAERARQAGDVELARDIEGNIRELAYDRGTRSYQPDVSETMRRLELQRIMADTQAGKDRQSRSNAAFIQEMRKLSKGHASGLSKRRGFAGILEASVFFMATRDIWEAWPGGTTHQVEAVAAAKGYRSFAEMYEAVMATQADALRRIDQLTGAADYDDTADLREATEMSFAERYRDVTSLVVAYR